MGNVLEIENLKHKKILNDITFCLEQKTFNLLIGPKKKITTLLNCINGSLKFKGTIKIFNTLVNKNNICKGVGYFLNVNIYFENTVFDSLYELLSNIDYDEETAKKRIYSVAKKLGITKILYKTLEELSNYEKTLITFMHSIIHNPQLIIITNDLEIFDDKNKQKILKYIKGMKNATILFMTTNSEYFNYAENILIFNEDKIEHLDLNKDIVTAEKLLIKNGTKLPFNIDLSNKLISYELIESVQLDLEKMVNEIWK